MTDYRKKTIEIIKVACQDIIDRADELVPNIKRCINTDILIHIPTLTDDSMVIPTVTVTSGNFISRVAEDKIFDILSRKD